MKEETIPNRIGEIDSLCLIESILNEDLIKAFPIRSRKKGYPITQEELIQEVEDFYDKHFPNN